MSIEFFVSFSNREWVLNCSMINLYPGYSVKKVVLGSEPMFHMNPDTKELGIISKEFKYLFKVTESALVLYTYENLAEF